MNYLSSNHNAIYTVIIANEMKLRNCNSTIVMPIDGNSKSLPLKIRI